jgi:hypothetical protein
LLWGALLIRGKTGNTGGRAAIGSFVRSGLAALLAGAAAWQVTMVISSVWLQLLLGMLAGLSVYGLALLVLGSPEGRSLRGVLIGWVRLKLARPSVSNS